MSGTIKLRTRIGDGIATIKVLIRHPMRVGNLRQGGQIAPHYITRVICEHNGAVVLNADWGTGISQNPYLSFAFAGARAGDRFRIRWTDNEGREDALEAGL